MTVKISKPAVNLREELNELKKPRGSAGEAMLRAETPQEQQALIGVGRRNLLINGDFKVSQRGVYTSTTSVANNTYYLDRWRMALGSVAGTVQHNEVVLPNGIKTMAMKVSAATSNTTGYVGVRHVIEDFRALSGQVVTASMWVRTTLKSMTFRHDSTANFGNVVSPDGQWYYHTATYQMPTITAAGGNANQTTLALINYTGSAGGGTISGEYFEVAQVQLELGSVATPFEHRSYGEELALCERYYQKSYDKDAYVTGSTSLSTVGSVDHYGSSDATNVLAQVYFRTQMRDAPTVTTYDPNSSNGGNAYAGRAYVASNSGTASYNTTTNNIGSTGFRSYVPKNGAGWAAHRIIFQWQSVAEL